MPFKILHVPFKPTEIQEIEIINVVKVLGCKIMSGIPHLILACNSDEKLPPTKLIVVLIQEDEESMVLPEMYVDTIITDKVIFHVFLLESLNAEKKESR